MADPVTGQAVQQAATPTRINDLDALPDENVNLSMNFAIDQPNETFKMTFQQIVDYIKENVLNNQYLVGDIIIGTTTDTPAARGLTGTWAAIEDQTSLNAVGLGNSDLGTITGENDPVIPVPLHTHTATSTFSGEALAAHTHDKGTLRIEGAITANIGYGLFDSETDSGAFVVSGNGTVPTSGPGYNNANTLSLDTDIGGFTGAAGASSAGTPAGAVTTTNAETGTDGAVLNVQGKVLNVVLWIKTAL